MGWWRKITQGLHAHFALVQEAWIYLGQKSHVCPDCGLPDPQNNPYCFCAKPAGSEDKRAR